MVRYVELAPGVFDVEYNGQVYKLLRQAPNVWSPIGWCPPAILTYLAGLIEDELGS